MDSTQHVTTEERSSYPRSVAALAGQYRKIFSASVAANLLLQISLVVDTIIVGQLLGPVPMSGVRVASPMVNILSAISMLVGVGGATLVSLAIGRRDHEAADRAFTLTIVLGIVLGIVYGLAVNACIEPLVNLISSDESTKPYTITFLRIVTMASPVYILASAMALLLRSDACIRLSSVVLALGGVANVTCDLLFMGALGMGVEGSALATDAGMLVAVLASLLYFRWPHRSLRLRSVFGGVKGQITNLLKNGMPSSLRMLFACISLLFLNYVVGGSVGVEGIAFLTVCGNIQLLTVAFFSAGGQAAMPMEGVLYGERDYNGLRLLMAYVFRVILLCVAAIIVVAWLFPGQIVRLFVPQGIEGSDWLLRLYVIGFVPLAINYVMTYYYNTIQQRKAAMTLTVCENLVIYLPLISLLVPAMGLIGAVLAFVLAELLAFCVVIVVALRLKQKLATKSILLIPDVPRELVYEATTPASQADASAIAHNVQAALTQCGVEKLVAMRTTIGVEEMVANAALSEHNKGRNVLFDILVSDLPTCVQVSLRDNGAPFDPTNPELEDEGIKVMLAVASSVRHGQSLGMNQTVIEVNKEVLGSS